MFRLAREPIRPHVLTESGAGACVTFEGMVRNHHQGRNVQRLEYEAFDEMAEAEGNRVIEEALAKFDILGADCTHRVGELEIGEVAVRVDVLAAHRREAFEACSWIIDAVKDRVPIWKKETYAEGDASWVNAEGPSEAGTSPPGVGLDPCPEEGKA